MSSFTSQISTVIPFDKAVSRYRQHLIHLSITSKHTHSQLWCFILWWKNNKKHLFLFLISCWVNAKYFWHEKPFGKPDVVFLYENKLRFIYIIHNSRFYWHCHLDGFICVETASLVYWLRHWNRNWGTLKFCPTLGTKAAGWLQDSHFLSPIGRRQWQTTLAKKLPKNLQGFV